MNTHELIGAQDCWQDEGGPVDSTLAARQDLSNLTLVRC